MTTQPTTYEDFLKSKVKTIQESGFELKTSYYDVAEKNVKSAELLKTQVSLF
jgi:hypothetical protein